MCNNAIITNSGAVIAGNAWAAQTHDATNKMIKVIRSEYTNPIDNLASLKHAIVP